MTDCATGPRRSHRMPFGTRIVEGQGVRFRIWAPDAPDAGVELCLEGPGGGQEFLPMRPLADGWFECISDRAGPGSRYRFRIAHDLLVPDPASRFQAGDVHGPSVVVDPEAFVWPDPDWRGRPWEEAVFYELHVGAFSPAGTFAGVIERLDYLAGLGITAIELMPVADFPGRRNWGYDGVLPFAPHRGYGGPEDLKRLVAEAHQRSIMVFLDVVYNHFGPEGNYLYVYGGKTLFTERHRTPWGDAVNFDGPGSRGVRDFFIHNALYWLNEYHLDGLRLDACHAIFDDSSPDILEEIALAVRRGPGRERLVHLVLENDANRAGYLARDAARAPKYYAAQWNDDLHHACHVLLTGEKTGYYRDYAETPLRHLGRCLAEGFAYQGEPSPYRQGVRRGERSRHLPLTAFVSYLQNHDQIGKRAQGERLSLLTDESRLRLAAALLLLAPSPPLLFMGEEFAADTPFLFFCDFGPDLANAVTEGRRREFARFPEFRDPEASRRIPDPNAVETFERSRLDWQQAESARGRRFHRLYLNLLALRQEAITPLVANLGGGSATYRLIGPEALLVRWQPEEGPRLLVLVNFAAEPVALPQVVSGTLLYADPPESGPAMVRGGNLPGRTIVWFLEGAPQS